MNSQILYADLWAQLRRLGYNCDRRWVDRRTKANAVKESDGNGMRQAGKPRKGVSGKSP